MNQKLTTALLLLVFAALAGCSGTDLQGEPTSDEDTGEASSALCTAGAGDVLVHFAGGTAGTAYTSTSALATDQYPNCTDRYVVNVDSLTYYSAYKVIAAYAGSTPTNQSVCEATHVTADARGRISDWLNVISLDVSANGVWFTPIGGGSPFCVLPSVTLYTEPGNANAFSAISVRVKAWSDYRGVYTAEKGKAGLIAQ